MIARDMMTRDVVSVTPDTPVRKIASLLVKHGIGAVPVIDGSGAPIGIVSESDLIRPDRAAREAWRQSWLEILAEGEPLAPELRLVGFSEPQRARRHVCASDHGERGDQPPRNCRDLDDAPHKARPGGY
jgi:hypothetical protein